MLLHAAGDNGQPVGRINVGRRLVHQCAAGSQSGCACRSCYLFGELHAGTLQFHRGNTGRCVDADFQFDRTCNECLYNIAATG